MSEDYDFDIAIIGAGPAGTAAALTLAERGIETVVIERGAYPGAKNVSGGALYGPILNELVPNYWEEDGIERYLTTKKITLMDEKGAVTMDVFLPDFGEPPYNGVTVLRPKFDRWLASKAEEKGAMILTDSVVDDFVYEGNMIKGVKSEEDEIRTKMVIIAEGANRLLTEKAGLAKVPNPEFHAVAMKETYQLPKETIEERFHLDGNEGVSNEILGFTQGIPGGGFFYTNKDTLSFGLILNMNKLTKKGLKATEVFERYRKHPYIRKLLKDAKLIEYSGHTIPEGGFNKLTQLHGNGVMVTGDAAGMVLNAGLYIEGMNFALASGKIAGEAAAQLLEQGDFSAKATKLYVDMLKKSFVYQDLKTFRRAAKFLERESIFTKYPRLATNLMFDLLHNTGQPRKRIVKTAIKHVFKAGIFGLINDAFGAWRSI